MKHDQEESASSLEPWGPVLGVLLMDGSSDFVLNTLRVAGIPVDDFNLNERESHSHNTRKRAYQERLGAIYGRWNNETRLRVCVNIANQLLKSDAYAKPLLDALAGVGWTIRHGKLAMLDTDDTESTLVTSQHGVGNRNSDPIAPRSNPVASPTPFESGRTPGPQPDARRVFVVHGRNVQARRAMFAFLRAVGLDPMEWEKAVSLTNVASPLIPQTLDRAFQRAQAVVVLLTGDDLARLRTPYQQPTDPSHERKLTPQPRQNVLFEAGMALATKPERTILVGLGEVRPFSDIDGRHVVRMSNDAKSRNSLIARLSTAGCAVDIHGKQDWLDEGDFDGAIESSDSSDNPNTGPKTAEKRAASPRATSGKIGPLQLTPIVEPKNHYLCLNLTNYTREPIADYTIEVLTLERWSSIQRAFLKNPEFKPIRLLMCETIEPEIPRLCYVVQPNRRNGFFLSGKLFDGSGHRFEVPTEGTYRAQIVFRSGVWQQNLNLDFEWTPDKGLAVAPNPEMEN